MRSDVPRLVVALALAAAGVVVLVRATQGGGPIYYFVSAVLLGMGFAAFQGRGGQGQGRDPNTGAKDGSRASGRSKGGRAR